MPSPLPGKVSGPALRDATVQEIQLELIRRTEFNAFRGERIYASLAKHRDLWESVVFDRIRSSRGILAPGSRIELRDVPANIWNADTLFILTPNVAAARELSHVHDSERWGGEFYIFQDADQVDNALGGTEFGKAIVRVWWD